MASKNKIFLALGIITELACSSPRHVETTTSGDAGAADVSGELDGVADSILSDARVSSVDGPLADGSNDLADGRPSHDGGPDVAVLLDGPVDSPADLPADVPSDLPPDAAPDLPPDMPPAPQNCDCAPKVPAGWAYVRVAEEDGSRPPTACPSGYQAQVPSLGLGVVDTGCGACKCGKAAGVTCGVEIKQYSDGGAGCTGSPFAARTQNQVMGSCWCIDGDPKATGLAQWMKAKAVVNGGRCDPSADLNPARFATTITACAPTSKPPTCGLSGACLPKVQEPYQDTVCIMRLVDGEFECPAGFPDRRAYATGISDDRSCTGCLCSSPTPESVTCSEGTVIACADTDPPKGNALETCVKVPVERAGNGICIQAYGIKASGGECKPLGSSRTTGAATPAATRVVCCN